jgi:glucose-1-phosphate thymidylyltransferase
MAGYGKRLRPHTWSKPKPLVSVAGKTVLAHFLDAFQALDVDEVVFIIGYLGDQVREYIAERYPQQKARYVVQEQLTGQSHAIWLAREGIEGPTLVAFVDTLIDADFSTLDDVGATTWAPSGQRRSKIRAASGWSNGMTMDGFRGW